MSSVGVGAQIEFEPHGVAVHLHQAFAGGHGGLCHVIARQNVGPYTAGQLVAPMRVILDGLKPDDRVVVDGLLRAIPGQKVDPKVETLTPPSQT